MRRVGNIERIVVRLAPKRIVAGRRHKCVGTGAAVNEVVAIGTSDVVVAGAGENHRAGGIAGSDGAGVDGLSGRKVDGVVAGGTDGDITELAGLRRQTDGLLRGAVGEIELLHVGERHLAGYSAATLGVTEHYGAGVDVDEPLEVRKVGQGQLVGAGLIGDRIGAAQRGSERHGKAGVVRTAGKRVVACRGDENFCEDAR